MVGNPTTMRFHGIPARLLGAPARVAVVSALLSAPSRDFTGRELARQAGVSHPQALEALRLLEWEGVVHHRRVGRSSLWSVETRHFLSKRLRDLAALDLDARRALTSSLERALKAGKAAEAYLFGSVAKGSEEPTSDVDVLAIFYSVRAARSFESRVAPLQDKIRTTFGNELHLIAYGPEAGLRPGARRLLGTARREGIRLEVGK
jgi:predicted nucleotidyltransferase